MNQQKQLLFSVLKNKNVQRRLLSLTNQKRFASSSTERSPIDPSPGHEKRTVVDLSRKQPEYELPYQGPQEYNINKSGFDDTYDVWWEDGAGQKQWAYKDNYSTLSTGDVLLHTVYFLGWAISLWAFYRHFLQPTIAMHPATLIPMRSKEKAKAKELQEQRLEEMEKYGIEK